MGRAFAFGEAMLRLSPPAGGRLQEAASLDLNPAGAELNTAVALAGLGMPAIWLSALPENALGRRVAAAARAAGVDVSAVNWIEGARMGLFFVEFGVPPRPVTVLYDRRDSAFQQVEPELAGMGAGDWLIVSGVTLALGARIVAATERLVVVVGAAGARLCVNVNYRSRLWSTEEAATVLAPMLERAELVVLTETDAASVLGLEGGPEEMVRSVAREWAPAARIVVLTRGADGSVGWERGGEPVVQPAYPTRVVDRLGAGDAFLAGLIWGLERGPLADAMAAGSALAALKCTVRGDFAQFTPAEVSAVVERPEELLSR
jgi:2-dehydro-3-deoxygluconokinase